MNFAIEYEREGDGRWIADVVAEEVCPLIISLSIPGST